MQQQLADVENQCRGTVLSHNISLTDSLVILVQLTTATSIKEKKISEIRQECL